MNPVEGVALAFLSIAVVYVLPVLMYMSLLEPVNSDGTTYVLDPITSSLSFILGFLHVYISGIVIASLSAFSIFPLLVMWGLVPASVCIWKRVNLLKSWVYLSLLLQVRRNRGILFIVLGLAGLLRFPVFNVGETGYDSYLFHSLTTDLLESGGLDWAFSALSLIEWFPGSKVASPIILIGGMASISGMPVHESIFLSSSVMGIQSTILFYLMAQCLAKRFGVVRDDITPIVLVIYATLPLLIKLSDWTVTGRLVYLAIAPAIVILFVEGIYASAQPMILRIQWVCLGASAAILAHGMGRILVLFGVVLLFVKILLSNYPVASRLKWFRFGNMIRLLAMILFVLPYVLALLGIGSLVSSWVITRSDITSSLSSNVFGFFIGFAFIFSARMGVIAPLFLLTILTAPYWKKELQGLTEIVLSVILFFPFFAQSMYFYQSLSIVMVFVGGTFLVVCVQRLRNLKISLAPSEPELHNVELLNSKSARVKDWFLVGVVLLCFTSTLYIQYYRVSTENASIPTEVLEMSEWIDTNHVLQTYVPFSIVASNPLLSARLDAFSKVAVCFPMRDTIYLSSFAASLNMSVYMEISPSLYGLIQLFRNGPFRMNFSNLKELNRISYEGSADEFANLKQRYDVRYLCHDMREEWPLLRILLEANMVLKLDTFGFYVLYTTTFVE